MSSEHATVETTTVPAVEAVPDRVVPSAPVSTVADLQVAPAWSREEDRLVTDPDGPDERRADAVAEALIAAAPPSDRPDGDVPPETPGAGVPLPPRLRAWAERVTTADLHDVRLHRSPAHERTADLLGARAFTRGRDVVLGAGTAPLSTRAGLATLAHELGHVVAPPRGGRIGRQQVPDQKAEPAPPPDTENWWRMRVPPQSLDGVLALIPDLADELLSTSWDEAAMATWTEKQLDAGAPTKVLTPETFVVATAEHYVAATSKGVVTGVTDRTSAAAPGSLSNEFLYDLSSGWTWVMGTHKEPGKPEGGQLRKGQKAPPDADATPGKSYFVVAIPDVHLTAEQLKKLQQQAKVAAAKAAGPPGWSKDQVAKLRKRRATADKEGAGGLGKKGTGEGGGGEADQGDKDGGTGQEGTTDTPPPLRGPAKLDVFVGGDGEPVLQVTVDRARTYVGLKEGETDEHLEARVDKAVKDLQASRDPANSLAVAKGVTGFVQPKGSTDGVAQTGDAAGKQAGSTELKTTPGEQKDAAKGGIANAPEYPSKMELSGRDPQFAPTTVRGATNEFTMTLDYAARSISMQDEVFNRLQDIQFYWEIIEVTNLKAPANAPLMSQEDAEKKAPATKLGAGEEKGRSDALKTNLARDMNAIAEDQQKDIAKMSSENWSWEARAAYLGVIGISNTVRVLGSIIGSFIDTLTQPLNARSLGFDHDGDYIVRCVATPLVSDKARADPDHYVIRKSSVAVMPIRVQAINARATEAVGREEADLHAKEAALAEAQGSGSETKKKQAQADLDAVREASRRGGLDTFTARVAYVREQVTAARALKAHREAHADVKEWSDAEVGLAIRLYGQNLKLDAYLAQMEHALESMTKDDHEEWVGKKAGQFKEVGGKREFRPRMVLASEETGQVSELLCMLGQLSPGPDAPWRWALVDITSPGTRNIYEGSSSLPGAAGRSAAIRDAFRNFAENADYGRGTLAIRMPQELIDAVGAVDVEATMRSAPGDWKRVTRRLADLARVAGALALVLTGPAAIVVGAIAGVAGAVVSVDALMKRSATGHLLEGGTLFDILGVIGGVASVVSLGTMLTADAVNAAVQAKTLSGGVKELPKWVRNVQMIDRVVHIQGQVAGVLTLMKIPYDLVKEWGEIDASDASEGQKSSRKMRALLHALESGSVTVVGMAGGLGGREPAGRPKGEPEVQGPKAGEPAPKTGEPAPKTGEPPAAKPAADEPAPIADVDAVAAAKTLAAKRLAEAAQAEREVVAGKDEEVLPDEQGRTARGTSKGTPEPQAEANGDKNTTGRDEVLALLEARVGQSPKTPAADPVPPKPGEYGAPTKSAADAVAQYDKGVAAVGGKREVGLFYNPNTGEFQIMIGSEHAVRSPQGDGWQALIHLHPNPENIVTFRLPAPADIEGSVMAAMRGGGHVEYVQSTLPDGTTMLTKVTVTTKPLKILVEMPARHGEPPRVIEATSPQDYANKYGADTTFLDPTSDAYKWVMNDLDAFYAAKAKDEGRTARGTVGGAPKPAATAAETRSASQEALDRTQRQLETLRDRATDPREKGVYESDLADLAKLREELAKGDDITERLANLDETLAGHNEAFAPVKVSDIRALALRATKAATKTKKAALKAELMRIANEATALADALDAGKKPKADPRETLANLRRQELVADAQDYSVVIDLSDAVLRKEVRDWIESKAAKLKDDPVGQLLLEKILEHVDNADALTLQQSPRSSGKGAADTASMRAAILEAVKAGLFPAEYVGAFDQGVKNAERLGHDDGWPRDSAGRAWEVDHVAELWLGGGDDISNYMALPESLHDLKSRVFAEFMGRFRSRRVVGDQVDIRSTGGVK
ncbi:hypothetical protein ASC77_09410 [Nocardioides sp. Root1257]|uniref:eCIS core domain-containing protein n=1 Tax=unclassified Nocardioides TaxID=2615069 RepID=UPI0006F2BF34|nr:MULTISPECIES: DUF4157 domain-containing protein [unclassified Nocardioides]KQW48926.1 hypothetical protein ASC77_09410 [Nocardioides sp. Root1257]KRC48101.1 hypothetical protein ASE24_09415 [Nocardioides sp. Root224]